MLKTTRLEETVQHKINKYKETCHKSPNILIVAPNIEKILQHSKKYKNNTLFNLGVYVDKNLDINNTNVTHKENKNG